MVNHLKYDGSIITYIFDTIVMLYWLSFIRGSCTLRWSVSTKRFTSLELRMKEYGGIKPTKIHGAQSVSQSSPVIPMSILWRGTGMSCVYYVINKLNEIFIKLSVYGCYCNRSALLEYYIFRRVHVVITRVFFT